MDESRGCREKTGVKRFSFANEASSSFGCRKGKRDKGKSVTLYAVLCPEVIPA
jgi:hypothetical protein